MRPETACGPALGVEALTTEAFERLPGSLSAGIILLCDHAANVLPEEYGTLGLPPAELARHIGYDIGARGVTVGMAAWLGAPAVMTRYSRLLIDCNRGEDDPTLIMRLSDGAIVPGNRSLTVEERAKRIARYYDPYHAAVAEVIDRALGAGIVPVLLSVHSFTPAWRGVARPWHGAVLWDKDPRLAHALLTDLGADPALVIGDNEPYTGRLKGDCMWRHGTSRGLAHAIIEIRQDLIASESGQAEWAGRLAEAMQRILAGAGADPDVRAVRFFGSDAD
ncbi:N-formylglutamate amidohydrolase [Hyphomicrobium sp.]|uniref:N-formylglutamate amidohydrolase n=1 Tax=Hyphomicrobium sp. TaxID=82 RepID=UPI0025C5D80D|nr:N-formylglutamate amidohydrolase [Hyphomicrobium sp.]MCC7251986.1 N-formylglutamate amidohydrolase [Hyphomicrobium sp.]